MIAIRFSPHFEDRVSVFFKTLKWDKLGISYKYNTPPTNYDEKAYWIIEYKHAKTINVIMNDLVELKNIMGVNDIEFQYCHNIMEYYQQTVNIKGLQLYQNNWFKI